MSLKKGGGVAFVVPMVLLMAVDLPAALWPGDIARTVALAAAPGFGTCAVVVTRLFIGNGKALALGLTVSTSQLLFADLVAGRL